MRQLSAQPRSALMANRGASRQLLGLSLYSGGTLIIAVEGIYRTWRQSGRFSVAALRGLFVN